MGYPWINQTNLIGLEYLQLDEQFHMLSALIHHNLKQYEIRFANLTNYLNRVKLDLQEIISVAIP